MNIKFTIAYIFSLNKLVCALNNFPNQNNCTNKEGLKMATPLPETSEVLNRWSNRWDNDNIGWHIDEVHPALVKYFPSVVENLISDEKKKIRVLVPLCGKSKDLLYLANHPSVSEVVGVEGVQKAVDDFIDESPQLNFLPVGKEEDGIQKFVAHVGNNISIWKGNFFDLADEKNISNFDFVWDRASIIAISPHLRNKYANVISRVLNPHGATMLFGTIDRREGTEEWMKAGPPFTVTFHDLQQIYGFLTETCQMLEEGESKSGLATIGDVMVDVVTLIQTKAKE